MVQPALSQPPEAVDPRDPIAEKLRGLAASLSPDVSGVATTFWAAVTHAGVMPNVGPSNDDGVVFEWDLENGTSVYCFARGDVEVSAFDDDHDYVQLHLSPAGAARVVSVLLEESP